ncbi:hypothetical protein B0H11DRAFT_23118 [Mycena galericulata]|nr:hypothetical protein B0H11DRAFT_23118 [Mycena galericulata]
MARIDYSKWDNIDTDSDSEPEPQSGSTATSAAQQIPPQPSQAASSEPGTQIKAVIVRCDLDKRRGSPWSATTIPADHPAFALAVPPIPTLIEVPLVTYRVGTQGGLTNGDLDNQIATFLNIDAASGFAPPEWQSGVGTVIVARKDRKPLLPHHMEGVWMYCDSILDNFGDEGKAPRHRYSRAAFEKWWANYCKEQRGFRRGRGGEDDPDDWRDVKSPYEV